VTVASAVSAGMSSSSIVVSSRKLSHSVWRQRKRGPRNAANWKRPSISIWRMGGRASIGIDTSPAIRSL
jgi:hypothetical protein